LMGGNSKYLLNKFAKSYSNLLVACKNISRIFVPALGLSGNAKRSASDLAKQ
jgi:hypothetical protein